jgi:predicted lipoprotein
MKIHPPRSIAAAVMATAALIGVLAYHLVAASESGPSISKQAVLDNVAQTVLLPAYVDLAAKCRDLAAAGDALTSSPTIATLQKAQQAWRETLLAWRRTQSFVHGPVSDLGVYGRIQFWPTRRQSVDRVLRADRAIDDAYIQELGANAVGLSALEMLLFDVRLADEARVASFKGAEGARQRQYFRALTTELVRKTADVAAAWSGPTGYAARFGAAGQDHLNLLVNDLLRAIESGAQGRLRAAIEGHDDPTLRKESIEGGPSGTAQPGLIALLTAAQNVFAGGRGAGIDDYLQQIAPGTARRVDAQFQKTLAAVRAIAAPLDQATASNTESIERAEEACRALEVLLKTEAVSSLGVTLTFKSKDGD